jgi:cytochrome P450
MGEQRTDELAAGTECPAGPEQAFIDLWHVSATEPPTFDVGWDADRERWLIPSYAAYRQVALDDDSFEMERYHIAPGRPQRERYIEFRGGVKMVALLSGEEHQRMHRWFMTAFSPKKITQWRETLVRPVIDELIARFAGRGSADLVDELALEAQLRVMLRVLGFPTSDEFVSEYVPVLRAFSQARFRILFLKADDDEVVRILDEVGLPAAARLRELMWPVVEERRLADGDDVVSDLWRHADEIFDDPWDADAIFANAQTMFEAGTTLIRTSAAAALSLLAGRKDIQERLIDGGAPQVTRFVEETLRMYPPNIYLPRYAAADVEVEGHQIKKGDRLSVVALTANRDERHYSCPHQFDMERKSPKDHVAFSVGIRHCPGHALSRAILEEMVAGVLRWLPNLRYPEGSGPPELAVFPEGRRAIEHVNVVFDPQTVASVAAGDS